MPVRPPSDAVVALRSLPRRYRGLFAGLDDDESPDALAHRAAGDGSTALGLLVGATSGLTATAQGLTDVLAHPGASVADPLGSSAPADGGLEERLAELDRETEALAEQVERVQAERWEQSGTLASTGEAISALALLWRGVDAAVEALRAAERTLREVRGR